MKVQIGELERVDYGDEDIVAWRVELTLTAPSLHELDQDQRRLERFAEARLQVVLAEGAEDFDPGERSIFFTIAPRTLDLRQELQEFIASLVAPTPPEPDYPLSSPFDLFGAGATEVEDQRLGL
jgi:hypothetical protein